MTTINGQPATLDAAAIGFGNDTIRSPLDAAIERGLQQVPGVDPSLLSFHVHKRQADGTWAHCCKVAFNDFDEDGLARAYGAGTYRLFLRAPNRRSQLCNIDLTLAAPMSTNPSMLSGTTMPAAAPAAAVGDMGPKDMLLMMMQAFSLQQQSQTTLMNTLLTRVMEPPQQRSLSEMEALLTLADRLAARGGDAEGTITSQTINALGSVLTQAMNQPRPPAPPPPQHHPGAGPGPGPGPGRMQLTGPISGPLPLPTTTPASASVIATPATQAAMPGGEALIESPDPTDAQAAALNEWMRLVEMTAASPSRDPQSFATLLADLVGDEALEIAIDQTPHGHLVDALLEAAPQLHEQRDFLMQVESAVRELFAPDDDAPGVGGAGEAWVSDNNAASVEIQNNPTAGEDIPFGGAIAGGNAVKPSTLTAPAVDKPHSPHSNHAATHPPITAGPAPAHRSPHGRAAPGPRVPSIAPGR